MISRTQLRVLLVDDETSFRVPLARYLRENFSYSVIEATMFDEALDAVDTHQLAFDVALLDNMLMRSAGVEPERIGIELMHAIQERSPFTEFVLFTGWGLEKDWEAIEQGAFRFLSKSSLDPDEVGHLLRQASEFGRLKEQNVEKRILEQLMATSPQLLRDARLEDILNSILEAIHAVGFDRVRLYLLSQDKLQLVGKAHIGMSADFVDSVTPVAQHPTINTLFETLQPVVVNVNSDQPVSFEYDERLKQYGCIPLIIEGEVRGKIGIDNIDSQRPITDVELRPIATFADQAATAIQTARLREQKQRRQRKLDVIRDVSAKLNSQYELHEILTTLCRTVVELFDVEHSGFVVFDDGHEKGRVAAEYPGNVGILHRQLQIDGIPDEEALVHLHQPIIVDDVAAQESLGSVRDLLLEFDIRSIAVVPAVSQGVTAGSFSLDAIGHQRQFTTEELELCQLLATQAATAIEKAHSFENMQRLSADSPVAIVANDRRGKITFCNKHAAQLLDYEVDELVGMNVAATFFLVEEASNIGERLRASEGRLIDHETLARTKTNQPVPIRLSVSWMYDGLGEHVGTLGHFEDLRDIERLRTQSKLHQSITDAIQAADALDDVFYLILTGATVGFGLGLNRAALFAYDPEHAKLVGTMGLGYLDAEENRRVWDRMVEQNLNTLSAIQAHLGETKPHTPLDERISGVEIPIASTGDDIFSQIIMDGHWRRLESESDLQRLPHLFRERFEPHFPLLVTALRSQGEVIGLLVADNKFNHHPIDDEIVQSMITLANTAAIAISKTQLLARTMQQANELERVDREAKQLAQSEGEKLLQEIILRSSNLLGGNGGGIYEYNAAQQILTVIADHSDKYDSIEGRTLQLGEGMAGKLVRDRRTHMSVPNYAEWEGRATIFDGKRPFGAVMEVLLRWRDEIVGVLYVEDEVGRDFSAEDVHLLQMFAGHAAIALKNSRLLSGEQLAWRQLRDLFEASTALAVIDKPDAVLEMAIQQARDVHDALNAGVILLDSENRPTYLYFAGEEWQNDVTDIVRPEGFSAKVKKTGQPFVCESVADEPLINPKMIQRAKAAICLPFTVRGEHVGVMWVHYDNPRAFKDTEIVTLQLYANQAAVAYDQARQIETLEYMREAAEALSSSDDENEVLHQIVESACTVLYAKSAAIWAYDDERDQFIREQSVAAGIANWEMLRNDPRPGRTTHTVLDYDGVLDVEDVNDQERYSFLGDETRAFLQQNGVGAFQGVSLKVGDEHLGVLFINYGMSRSFSAEERRNVATFANHAAIALKKARLLAKLRHAFETARLIARLSVDRGLDVILEAIVKGAKDVLRCDAVVLYVYDAENERLKYPPKMRGVNNPERARRFEDIPDNSIVMEIFQQTEPYVCPDTSSDPKFKERRFTQDEHIRSLVAVRLSVRDEPVGVLFINYRHKHALDGEEIDNIQLFANQAAVAIHDTQLFEREEKRAGTLEALSRAGKVVMSSLNLNKVLDTISEQAWALARVNDKDALFCDILLADGHIGNIVSAYPPNKLSEIHDRLGTYIDWESGVDGCCGITGRAYKTRINQRIGNVKTDDDFIVSHEETRSAMAICIRSQGDIMGFIVVEHEDIDAFTERHEHILDSLAAYAAIAISHARYVEEVKRIKGFVGSHNAVEWMRMIHYTWGHTIKNITNDALLYLDNARFALAGQDTPAISSAVMTIEQLIGEIRDNALINPLAADEGVVSLCLNEVLLDYFADDGRRRRALAARELICS